MLIPNYVCVDIVEPRKGIAIFYLLPYNDKFINKANRDDAKIKAYNENIHNRSETLRCGKISPGKNIRHAKILFTKSANSIHTFFLITTYAKLLIMKDFIVAFHC